MKKIPIVFAEEPESKRLKNYRGWDIQFNFRTHKLDSPTLCLYGFENVVAIERAIDAALIRRTLSLWFRERSGE